MSGTHVSYCDGRATGIFTNGCTRIGCDCKPEPEQVKAFAYRLMLLHWHALAFQANATASRSGLAYYSLTLILAYSNIMIFLPAHIRAR